DIQTNEIPEIHPSEHVMARVIAGHSHGVSGAIQHPVTEPLYLDIHFSGPGTFNQPLKPNWNAFIYVYRGSVTVNNETIPLKKMAILKNDKQSDGVIIQAESTAKIILIAGKPLNEPIVQYGPFVMNTKEEIMQAVTDFQEGRLG